MNNNLETFKRRLELANNIYKNYYNKDLDDKSKELLADCFYSICAFYDNISDDNYDIKRSHLDYMTCICDDGDFIKNIDGLPKYSHNKDVIYLNGFADGIRHCTNMIEKRHTEEK